MKLFSPLLIVVTTTLASSCVNNYKQADEIHETEGSASENREEIFLKNARQVQTNYWTFKLEEYNQLSPLPIESLSYPQALRLLHLSCMKAFFNGKETTESVNESPEFSEIERKTITKLITKLNSNTSPYRARLSTVWQGEADSYKERQPDMSGVLQNASLTHLGCMEVIHLDENKHPKNIDFVPFDDLHLVLFSQQSLFRYAKLHYDDERKPEVVLVPLLYGLSWALADPFIKDGSMTRLSCVLYSEERVPTYSIGFGHQDLTIEQEEGNPLFGLGSISAFMPMLDTRDPKFRAKCAARGMDPDTVMAYALEMDKQNQEVQE